MKIDATGDNHIKHSKPPSERQISYIFSHLWGINGIILSIFHIGIFGLPALSM